MCDKLARNKQSQALNLLFLQTRCSLSENTQHFYFTVICVLAGRLEDAEIAKVPDDQGGGSHFELRNVPESGRDRLVALFHVSYRPKQKSFGSFAELGLDECMRSPVS